MLPRMRFRDVAIGVVIASLFWLVVIPVAHRPAAAAGEAAGAAAAAAAATTSEARQLEQLRRSKGGPPEELPAAGRSSVSALGLRGGDRLVLYRAGQPYYHQQQIPHDWIVVRALNEPSFFQVIGDPAQDHLVSSMLWDGWYENDESQVVLHLLASACSPDNSLFVDVGANLGWFSMLAASRGYSVVAFEPQAHLVQLVKLSIALNEFSDRVVLHERPVGAEDGIPVTLRSAAHNWGGVAVEVVQDARAAETERTLLTIALDTALAADASIRGSTPSVCVLKVDVEGFEPSVFSGARQTLQRTSYVLLEFRDNESGHKALQLLEAAGFNGIVIISDECCAGPHASFTSSPNAVSSLNELRGLISRQPRTSEYYNLLVFRKP